MDIHQGAARVLLHRARAAFRRSFRSTAPTGAGGVTMLGLAAFLPELPVPASLQTPPPFASLAPQAGWPITSAPHLEGTPPDAGQAGLPGATSAASAPMAAVPAVSVPLAAAPIAPVGLLAGLGAAAASKWRSRWSRSRWSQAEELLPATGHRTPRASTIRRAASGPVR